MIDNPVSITIFVVIALSFCLSVLLQVTSYRVRCRDWSGEEHIKSSWLLAGALVASIVSFALLFVQILRCYIIELVTREQYDVLNNALIVLLVVQFGIIVVVLYTIMKEKDKGAFVLLPSLDW